MSCCEWCGQHTLIQPFMDQKATNPVQKLNTADLSIETPSNDPHEMREKALRVAQEVEDVPSERKNLQLVGNSRGRRSWVNVGN